MLIAYKIVAKAKQFIYNTFFYFIIKKMYYKKINKKYLIIALILQFSPKKAS